MSFLENFGTGIISGVVATALLALVAVFFKKVVIPHIQNILYPGPNVSGSWNIYYSSDENAASVGKAILVQRGTLITGNVENFTSRSGRPRTRTWSVTGKFRFGELIATYEDAASKGYNAGALIVKLSADSNTMNGNVMYLHVDNGEIQFFPFIFKRHAVAAHHQREPIPAVKRSRLPRSAGRSAG